MRGVVEAMVADLAAGGALTRRRLLAAMLEGAMREMLMLLRCCELAGLEG